MSIVHGKFSLQIKKRRIGEPLNAIKTAEVLPKGKVGSCCNKLRSYHRKQRASVYQRTFQCLGIYIDESLTWKSHISYICNKISKSVGISTGFVSFCHQTEKYLFIIANEPAERRREAGEAAAL